MKAVAIQGFGSREQLELIDLPRPHPTPSEVLVELYAAAVNPVDWKIREGRLKDFLPHHFPLILGWDGAGVIREIGARVERFRVGDEVYLYAKTGIVRAGTYAEYIALPEENVALKPKRLSFVEAACIPDAGLTAYQTLFDVLKLKQHETILIHAGAGGVGGYALQLAKEIGATVLTTASRRNHAYVTGLGADTAIDYTQHDFREAVRKHSPNGIDVVFDTVGGDVLLQSADVLSAGGRLVSVVDPPPKEVLAQRGIQSWFVRVRPQAAHLQHLASMADGGKLAVTVAAIFPLQDAAQAHEMSETRHTRGKIAFKIVDENN